MPINSRAKGKSAEREVINLLQPLLPHLKLERNLDQTRDGGYDIKGMGRWAAEVKRYAEVAPGDFKRFWKQTLEQAHEVGKWPVLFVREDRREWVAYVRLEDICDGRLGNDDWCVACLSMDGFVKIFKLTDWEI